MRGRAASVTTSSPSLLGSKEKCLFRRSSSSTKQAPGCRVNVHDSRSDVSGGGWARRPVAAANLAWSSH